DRPRVLLRVAPEGGRTRGDEELRDALLVQEAPDRDVVVRAEGVEEREHAVLLHELARREEGALRLVPVVQVLVRDLAAEDAAVVVHVLEVGIRALRDAGPGGGLAGERRRPAEQ